MTRHAARHDNQFLQPGIKELLDAIPAALFIKDSASRILFMNAACEAQWGTTLDALIGTDGSQFFPPEQMAVFLAKDRQVFAEGSQIRVEEPVWNATLGENRMVETFKRPVFDAAGQPLYLIGVTIDITERQQTAAHLRVSNMQLRSMYELTPMGIALTDMQGRYLEFNAAFERICGYTREELNSLDYWALTPKEYAAHEAAQLKNLAECGSYGPYEKEYIRKDGTRVPLRLNGVLIHGADGEPRIWSIVEDLTERRQRDELIWRQANFDRITALPNRHLFRDRLEQELVQARADGSQVALLLVNLDHFKDINDSFGHDWGDQLLAEAAGRVRQCLEPGAMLARTGGDEFSIVLTGVGDRHALEILALRVIEQLHTPFRFAGKEGFISASLGIAVFPADAADATTLVTQVEHAVQLAKNQGRDRFAYFTETMQRQAEYRRTLTGELRSALTRQELVVYYQPIVEARTHRIVKAEALLRWQHPQRGVVGPTEFIPLAEESGLIMDIGEWVLRESIRTSERWLQQLGRPIEISVNMSPLQFGDSQHADGWLQTLQRMNLPGRSIAIEITESMLLKDSSSIKQRLLDLRTLGIEVSIDDFGTGFSALSYLKKFDIDYLKIDRSFTSGLIDNSSDRALTEAIIVMAHKLGMSTIAEGVETQEQQRILEELGCDFLQGFLFARPVPQAEFEALLRAENTTPRP